MTIERFIMTERSGKSWIIDAHLESNPSITVAGHEVLFAGARGLLDQGYDPQTLLTTRWRSSKHDSFVPETIKWLAGRTVTESDKGGTRIEAWHADMRFGA